jgi:DtxR family transcriptional regulator, Mn-dependent transcriptional regulator
MPTGRVGVARIDWFADEGARAVNELIDTTEMYLRTIYELEEEGIVPLRARIAERLGQSGPTVSQTVARMERDGLVVVAGDRHLELTDDGRNRAVAVMRKHRLAERLLVDVIGLEWEHVHNEACRWEHVISDAVEKRLVELLEDPETCPHGNPIPGIGIEAGRDDLVTLNEAAGRGGEVVIRRISEKIQSDVEIMRTLREHGVRPGAVARLRTSDGYPVVVITDAELLLDPDTAKHLYVSART